MIRVEHGDCLEVIPQLVAEGVRVDAIVTDPPYHLSEPPHVANGGFGGNRSDERKAARAGFMNKAWDGGDIAFRPETWAVAYGVLKPGGYLLAFGGSRTHHRIWSAIEDAGFVIQDTIMWLYGSGFPKGRTQLKPAHEPICVAYKPGGKRELQIDECRIATSAADKENWKALSGFNGTPRTTGLTYAGGSVGTKDDRSNYDAPGRWPANICHDGSAEVMEAFASFGEKSSGVIRAGTLRAESSRQGNIYGRFPGNAALRDFGGDTGSAARFFKACPADDDELLIWRAKAIMAEWNPELANTADTHSGLSKRAAVSALSDAVTWASHEASSLIELSCRGLSTSVTPSELRTLSESAITAILKNENASASESRHEKQPLNGSHANVAVTTARTGITTITISHWRSDGSAAPVTFRCTPRSAEVGVPVLAGTDRFHYCAKGSKADRAGSKHPTVKPITLMRWLVRLVTPPNGTILDPFAGSGTTGTAAIAEGRNAILIEREDEYVRDIQRRLAISRGEGGHSMVSKHLDQQEARGTLL